MFSSCTDSAGELVRHILMFVDLQPGRYGKNKFLHKLACYLWTSMETVHGDASWNILLIWSVYFSLWNRLRENVNRMAVWVTNARDLMINFFSFPHFTILTANQLFISVWATHIWCYWLGIWFASHKGLQPWSITRVVAYAGWRWFWKTIMIWKDNHQVAISSYCSGCQNIYLTMLNQL